jgi:hypothetical protein
MVFADRDIQRTTTARPEAGHPSPYLNTNEQSERHSPIVTYANAAAGDTIFRCTPQLLVHRRGHDGPRISGQAIAVIVLCAVILLCALVGCCLLRLPAMCPCLCGRFFPSDASPSSARSTPRSGNNLFDVEMMGDQPVSLTGGPSPPPPYTRAPSYETSGSTTGERSDCT